SRRRHTRSKRDWSSDVCSSDLEGISEGATIGITSDAGNQPRALMLLEEAGLLEDIEDESAALTLTEEQNPMNLEFEENPPEILRSEERRVGKGGEHEGDRMRQQ